MKTAYRANAILLSAVLAFAIPAGAKEIVLPQEQVQWRPSSLPGYQKVVQECTICHSAHYAEYQPTSTTRNYWETQVKRMKTVFNAPIPDDDIPLITEYLTRTYSVDRSKAAGQ
ncbi:hypothetical protein [Noviherbaspirillum massiliense]|uniref:SorB family sulfite dehydrogenase c-type cytochrome subunit n=1 Tax=Noviherbaspirillum massiliense TaxID=1465823 RepID=UPI0002E6A572|nr:hypothetical protein [Noviherbaspirillum massiliense]